MQPEICVYHGNCSDGISSAYLVRENSKTPPEFWAGTFNENITPLLEKVKDKVVMFVDFSYVESKMLEIINACKLLIFIDHHESAEFMLKHASEKVQIVFDKSRSGCQLTWDYYFPNVQRHWLIDYVGDRDIWAFKLPNSKEVNEGIYSTGALMSIESLTENFSKLTLEHCLEEGKREMMFKDRLYDRYVKMGRLHRLKVTNKDGQPEEKKVWVVNGDHGIVSEVGNRLSQDVNSDFALIWRYDSEYNKFWISCRSRKDVNLLGITILGTNSSLKGHPNACGTESSNLDWLHNTQVSKELVIRPVSLV